MATANSPYITNKHFKADSITHIELEYCRQWLNKHGVRLLDLTYSKLIRAAIRNYAQYLQSSIDTPTEAIKAFQETINYRSE